jgi:hypothetical protein
VPTYDWIALGVFAAAFLGGCGYAGVYGWRAWKHARPRLRRMTEASEALNARSAELERRLAEIERKRALLETDVARLQRAVAQAKVMLGPVLEARRGLGLLRAFVPTR